MGTKIKLANGKDMPIVGLGTWQSPKKEVKEAVRVALDTGYRHIDTAYTYLNEDAIGEVLDEYLKAGKMRREDLFVVTKLPMIHMDEQLVGSSLKGSLERLRLSYVDLYLLHAPIGLRYVSDDVILPTDDQGNIMFTQVDHLAIWKSMESLVDSGLTKSIGLSNFNSVQIDRIFQNARIQPVTNQVECHLYFPQEELQEFCEARGIKITAYAPLGSPARIPVFQKEDAPVLLEDSLVLEMSKKYKKTPAQILLRNLMQRGIIVVPKSVTPKRIVENFQAFDFEISEADMKTLANIKHYERFFIWPFGTDQEEFPFHIPF